MPSVATHLARSVARPLAALLLLVVAVAVAIAACWSPASRHPDAADISARTAFVLKAQVRTTAFQGPAWRLHVVDAAPVLVAGELPDAHLVWRTLFGVRYGETVVADRHVTNSFSAWRYAGVPAAFVAAELVLLGGAAWLVRDRW